MPRVRGSSTREIVAGLLELAREQEDVVAERMLDAVRREVPEYGTISDPKLLAVFQRLTQGSIDLFCRCAAEDRSLNAEELERIASVAADQADLLIPLDVFVHASRVIQRVHRDWVLENTPRTAAGNAAGLALVDRMLEMADAGMIASARGYFAEQGPRAAEESRAKRDLLENLLAHGGPGVSEVMVARLGWALDGQFVVAVADARTAEETDRGSEQHEQALFAASLAVARHHKGGTRPLVVSRHHELVCIVPVGADPSSVTGELGSARAALQATRGISLKAGVSTPCALEGVPRAYEEALHALRMALTGDRDIVALADVSVFDYLVAQADPTALRMVPPEVLKLLDEDRGTNGSLLETLRTYIESDLNVGRTAEALLVHANTVHYRLRRIASITGRNTRSFWDLVDLISAIRLAETSGR